MWPPPPDLLLAPLLATPPLHVFLAILCGVLFGLLVRMTMPRFPGLRLLSYFTRTGGDYIGIGEETKMSLVVRRDLRMGAGKVAAQCAHAAVAVVEEILALKAACHSGHGRELYQEEEDTPEGIQAGRGSHAWLRWYAAWRTSGCAKVVLQCADEAGLREIAARAKAKRLPFYIVRDAGRTQVVAGSATVVAIGPGPRGLIDQITGDLKLY
ncbi:unnamed protein product [Phytomonas sp. Hart1]|nr:unnamed protein product [Phytomonas sp. Hart1]|eukprot:CCW71188.1 unnamed protein product [Phytomonas sp. isolate Hart1]